MKDGGYQFLFCRKTYQQFTGARVALLALTPVRFGRELPLIDGSFLGNVQVSVQEFVSSLSWRQGKDISKETVNLLEGQRKIRRENGPLIDDSMWFDLLLELAPLSGCLLNASYLKKELASLRVGERDATWSIYLVGKTRRDYDDWTVIPQLIDWAWVAPKFEIESEKIHLVAIALGLLTATVDRGLRDCAPKALAS
jgi:hypothetical protein